MSKKEGALLGENRDVSEEETPSRGVGRRETAVTKVDGEPEENRRRELSVSCVLFGGSNTNVCPAGGGLMTESECKAYAEATSGLTWRSAGSWSNRPKGCRCKSSGEVRFNRHPTGAANSYDGPICSCCEAGKFSTGMKITLPPHL